MTDCVPEQESGVLVNSRKIPLAGCFQFSDGIKAIILKLVFMLKGLQCRLWCNDVFIEGFEAYSIGFCKNLLLFTYALFSHMNWLNFILDAYQIVTQLILHLCKSFKETFCSFHV